MRLHLALTGLLLFASSACGKVESAIPDAAIGIDAPLAIDAPLVIDAPATCAPACGLNATCTGTTCACDSGFVGDGQTCRAPWEKIITLAVPLDLGNNRGFEAVGQAPSIYFAPIFDSGTTTFRSFNTTTLTVSAPLALPPGTQNDFQASGYGATFVADATALYLIGDEGQRYTPSADRWVAIPGYGPAAGFQRGESTGAWEGNNNAIFLIGGRDASNMYQASTLRYSIGGAWGTEAGVLPYTVDRARAYAPPGDNRTYVAGGSTGDNNRKHLAVHATGSGNWTVLPDAPGDLGQPTGMGQFTVGGVTRIWVATQSEVQFYNPASSTWDRTVAMPTTTISRVVMVGVVPYALVQNGANADVYKLVAIE